ncbi:MAG TPA: DUF72 domain-containing protein [Thermoplasmata archaeon]|nr:DUF72 domain-containing protein [Thermoplasmata archaeon]
MGRFWLGCSGWAYDDWVGPFYAPGTPPGEFLERYARVFRTVEVDSSFYRAPGPFLVRRWADRTPDGFRFSLKVPRDVTHETAGDVAGRLDGFVRSLEPLRRSGKLGPLVLQFPPSFRRDRGAERLERLLEAVPAAYDLAVELRHRSWWVDATRQALARRGAVLVWSVVPETSPPPWVTGAFLYARFIGDRALTEFGRVQRAGREPMEAMRARFEDEGRAIPSIFAYANNHFMGFGPGTVVELAQVLGEPAPDLRAAGRVAGQRTLDSAPPGPHGAPGDGDETEKL